MKSSFFVSLILMVVATGCVVVKPQNLNPADPSGKAHPNLPANPFSTIEKALFKATLDIKMHHLSGLMLIKQMDSLAKVYRLVFANEFGMTYYDFEIKADTFKVVSCFEPLYKKSLIKILETDYRLLLDCMPGGYEKVYSQEKTRKIIVYKHTGSLKSWKTYNSSGDTLMTISGNSNMADAVMIDFSGYTNDFPSKIKIRNQVIGMKQSLQLLSK